MGPPSLTISDPSRFQLPNIGPVPLSRFQLPSQADSPRPLGGDGRICVNYFVDLLSAVHVENNLAQLADHLAAFIRGQATLASCAAVVGPKAGNSLLVRETATRLGLKSGLVRESILFGRWVEGGAKPGDKVILADDVSADGEMLCEAVVNLRKGGIFTDHALVIVDRTEGDAARMLGELGVRLLYCYQLDDHQLRRLKEDAD